jgi:solute carrier family 6 amino acid transporter-like protein 5/7/9/14
MVKIVNTYYYCNDDTENFHLLGGGAFVIPYLIVLFLVGKPIYFLEATIGQFSSKGSVKVYDLCPACKGIGVGQVLSLAAGATYYSALISIIFKYFFDSFSSELPWGQCNPSWSNLSDIKCIPSKFSNNNQLEIFNETSKFNQTMSSAELYFV